jgi:AraC-like DNA-binding protein
MLEFQFASPYEISVYGTGRRLVCPQVAVIGPMTYRRVQLVIRGRVQALAVLFRPQGFKAIFNLPTFYVANGGTEGHSILGGEISVLSEKMGDLKTFGQRVQLLDQYFLQRADRSQPLPKISGGLNRLMTPGPRIKIADLAFQAGVTTRHLERVSLDYTGVSPKLLVRIARFQMALRMKKNSYSTWTEIAHSLEYHDQMHMIRDFRDLAGDTPVRAEKQIASDHLISLQSA